MSVRVYKENWFVVISAIPARKPAYSVFLYCAIHPTLIHLILFVHSTSEPLNLIYYLGVYIISNIQ